MHTALRCRQTFIQPGTRHIVQSRWKGTERHRKNRLDASKQRSSSAWNRRMATTLTQQIAIQNINASDYNFLFSFSSIKIFTDTFSVVDSNWFDCSHYVCRRFYWHFHTFSTIFIYTSSSATQQSQRCCFSFIHFNAEKKKKIFSFWCDADVLNVGADEISLGFAVRNGIM